MIDYRNTLNLPYTKFPMRANLVKYERTILERWRKDGLYTLIRQKKNKKKIFLLHDGPPYVNGNIHLGHAVNKILKDFILKYKSLSGYDAPYIPGWDCHGLPVELEVERLIGKPNINVDLKRFQNTCRSYVLEQVEIQKKDFVKLGVLADWDNPYLTMDFKVEANIIRAFGKIASNGYVYRGMKPVHWCFWCRSVLAESEVEYQDHVVAAIDITFIAKDSMKVSKIFNLNLFNNEKIELIIWTTTPWTLPANQAIAINPDYKYQLIKISFSNNIRYVVVVADLVNVVMNRIECSSWKILGETLGVFLESLRFYHPFMPFDVPVILSYHVSLDSGTGIVHIAPNYGVDDYNIVTKQYNFEKIINVVTDDGYYIENTHTILDGIHIFKATNIIIDLLNKSDALLYVDYFYKHSYPFCWRHRKPVIVRATIQWFLSMEYHNLRDQLLHMIRAVHWIPNKGKSSFEIMISGRPDWCISRQRVWGIPIPLFVHKYTKKLHPHMFEYMEIIAQYVENHGIEIWWDLKIEDILKNSEESKQYVKIFDTLDVWFDSGSTCYSVIPERLNYYNKEIDLYLEGSDQYRGWFMSSLIISTAIQKKAPYKTVLSHGFTVDAQGYKMSKSLGNIIRPQEIVDSFGADILRLWVASSDYSKDMTISNEILRHIIDIYRRIRNTARFCLSNLGDFNPSKHKVCSEDMVELDRWVVGKVYSIQLEIISDYDQYNFHSAVQRIMQFCSIEMGSFYLDVIKDRQYTTKKEGLARRSCQTALYHIIEAMVRWLAPILSFTADEIWRFIPGNRSKYVFTEEWYNDLIILDDSKIINNNYWDNFLKIRDISNKAIEQARLSGLIGSSLDASVKLYAVPELADQLRILGNELAFGLITSSATVLEYYSINDISTTTYQCSDEKILGLKIILEKAKGEKCPRCWHYELDIGQCKSYNNICMRCVSNIAGSGEFRKFF